MNAYLRTARVEALIGGSPVVEVDQSLRIAFSVRRDASSPTQPSSVTIYNLGQATENAARGADEVKIYAGYASTALLAEGQVRQVESTREGLERLTTIHLGQSDTRQATIYQSSHLEIPLPTLIADVVSAMGLRLHHTSSIIPHEVLGGWSYIGRARDVLTDLLTPRGIRWYELMGEIRFGAVEDIQASTVGRLSVSETTGMIGTPTLTERGVKVVTILDSRIEPSIEIEVSSEEISGTYSVISVLHRGDTWQGEYQSEMEAISL